MPYLTYQRRDCFLTARYRSGLIQTCWNLDTGKEEVRVLLPDGTYCSCRTYAGAKRIITRHIGFPPYWAHTRRSAA